MISFPSQDFRAPPLSLIPQPFPSVDDNLKVHSVLAPLWSNIDISSVGNVYYHLYTGNEPGDMDVLTRASEDFDFQFEETGLFNPTDPKTKMWVLVVTWYQVPRFEWRRTNSYAVIGCVDSDTAWILAKTTCLGAFLFSGIFGVTVAAVLGARSEESMHILALYVWHLFL